MLGQLANRLERKIRFYSFFETKSWWINELKAKNIFMILGVRKAFLSVTTKTEIMKEKSYRIDYILI